jgi:tRNA splicing ligase
LPQIVRFLPVLYFWSHFVVFRCFLWSLLSEFFFRYRTEEAKETLRKLKEGIIKVYSIGKFLTAYF